MATLGTKQQDGKPKKKTTVCLKPISYSMELQYLGDTHVTKGASYNCNFATGVGTAKATGIAAGTLVPTLVTGDATGSNDPAAKPMASGGSAAAPTAETTARILVPDTHTPRLADKATVNDLNRAQYYEQRGWMKDTRPALGFRMIIRRWAGDVQIPVKDALKLIAEVKDPAEEFAQTSGRPKTFVEEFFKKYNQQTGTPSVGDDNQPTWGEAAQSECRTHVGNPGYPATHVLRKMPWKKWTYGADQVTFAELTAATAKGQDAEFDTEKQDETNTGVTDAVFVQDFAFYPFPTAGDNYRFLFWLERGGTDLRKVKENGADVKLYDSADAELKHPWGYLTGKYTIWRKIPLKLIVLVNKLAKETVDWSVVNAKYKGSFTEIEPPADAGYYSLTESEWLKIFKNHFDPAGTVFSFTKWLPVMNEYDQYFYPPFLRDKENDSHTHPLTRAIIEYACTKVVPALQSPVNGADPNQAADTGIMVCMMRQLKPDHGDLGEFVYDRQLNVMVQSSVTPLQQCRTIAHEIGHAMSLRHAMTRSINFKVDGANVNLIHHNENSYQAQNHDPKHLLECLMGYTGVDDAEFCGMCSLVLRFYPIHKIKDPVEYGDTAMGFYSAGALFQLASAAGSLATTLPSPLALTAGNSAFVVAVGPAETYNPRWTAATNTVSARVRLTSLPGSAWTSSDTAIATVAAGAHSCSITAVAAGACVVKYKFNGLELTCNVVVT